MPSFKMKAKSTTVSVKEKYNLHICQKSSIISKDPLSHPRVSQNAEEIGTHAQTIQDDSVYDKVHDQDLQEDVDSHDVLHGEKHFQKQPSTIMDALIVDNMEPKPSTCMSNMETVLSPNLASVDLHSIEGSDNLYVPQLDSEDSNDSSRSSCANQAFNVSDFFISDMIFSAPPIGSNFSTDNTMHPVLLPNYKCEESSLLCDLTEEYLALPFLEDTLDTGCGHDGGQSEETMRDADNSSLYIAINQLRSYQVSHISSYPDPDYECFDPQLYITNLLDQPDIAFNLLPNSVPNGKQTSKRITLVLDLDETLVHSTLEQCDDADFVFPVFLNMKEHTVYVKQRPHLQTFLKRVAEMFEIVVFTASQSIYAKQLLDILDPDGKIISRRAYRESCIFSEGTYMKDLTIFGVDLAKVVIIDNSPQVFRLQVNNGIPIKSWFDDPSDHALISLIPFLETLVDADDVRPIIARKFGNKE